MSEPSEKKTFKERLSSMFSRKAKAPAGNVKVKPAPVPSEIYNDTRVQKAVFKARRRSFIKRLLVSSVAAAAISTGTQYYPDTVSTPLDQYMADKGHTPDFSIHFHAANIRVYDRWNPLYPFHLAGQGAKLTWQAIDADPEGGPIGKGISKGLSTAIIYPSMLFQGFSTLLMPNALDAYAIPNDAPHDKREVFIRPPGEIKIADFISDFGRVNSDKLYFNNSPKDLERVLYQYIMLHEARHGDQRTDVATSLNEADADRYAFSVLAARGHKKELLDEALAIITHSRTMASVLGGGTSHTTSVALLRPYQTPYAAYKDEAALQRLHKVLSDADVMNKDVFPKDMSRGNRFIYLAGAMNKQGVADKDPDMKLALSMFVNAAVYFNMVTGGSMIDTSFDLQKINISYLQQQYKPVEDKLGIPGVPAPAATGSGDAQTTTRAETKRPAPRPAP